MKIVFEIQNHVITCTPQDDTSEDCDNDAPEPDTDNHNSDDE